MTKKQKIHTLGVICEAGNLCGMRKPKKKDGSKTCGARHYIEVAIPHRIYTYIFDTVRPEMFLIDDKPTLNRELNLLSEQ